MNDPGHHYSFGAPAKKGWPTFGADGKIVREEVDAFGIEMCCASASFAGVCVKQFTCGAICMWAK